MKPSLHFPNIRFVIIIIIIIIVVRCALGKISQSGNTEWALKARFWDKNRQWAPTPRFTHFNPMITCGVWRKWAEEGTFHWQFLITQTEWSTAIFDLPLSKSKAYGFKENSVSFIRSCRTNRYQRTKIGSTLCDWNKIITGVLQGSILRPFID